MSLKLLVHLGPAKTATTSLQWFLSSERLPSLGVGLVEPFGSKGSHHDLARLLGARVPSGLGDSMYAAHDEESAIQLLRDSVARSEFELNVISSEFLAECPPAQLRDIFVRICQETTFVLAVRNPLAHAVSYWAEKTRGGSVDGLRTFLEDPSRFIDWWRSVYLASSSAHGSRLKFITVSESTPLIDLVSALFGSQASNLLEGLDIRKNVSNCPAACDVHAMLNGAFSETPTREGWGGHYLHESLREASAGEDRIIPSSWIASFVNKWESSIDVRDNPDLFDCLTRVSHDSGRLTAVTEDEFVSARQRIVENVAVSQARTNALAHLEIDRLGYLLSNRHLADRTPVESRATTRKNGPIIVMGDSHSLALERASNLLDPSSGKLLVFSERVEDAGVYWSAIERLESDCEMMCISWRGNEHNVLSILPHERFRLHHALDSSIANKDHGDPLVPISQIKSAFKRELTPLGERLSSLQSNRRLVILGPPPPKSRTTVLNNLGTDGFFGKRIDLQSSIEDNRKLLPDNLRMLLWELQNDEYRQFSASIGAYFIDAPRNSRSKSGFLKSMYASSDCTHANEHYGLLVLQEIIRFYRVGRATT